MSLKMVASSRSVASKHTPPEMELWIDQHEKQNGPDSCATSP